MSDKAPSFATDLSRVRHLGSARSGTGHAWAMRVTSLALMALSILFVMLAISLVGRDYDGVLALFSHRIAPGAIALLFVLTGVYHMKLGMQTIIEDYIHGEHAKMLAFMANVFFCGVIAAATTLAIIKLSLS